MEILKSMASLAGDEVTISVPVDTLKNLVLQALSSQSSDANVPIDADVMLINDRQARITARVDKQFILSTVRVPPFIKDVDINNDVVFTVVVDILELLQMYAPNVKIVNVDRERGVIYLSLPLSAIIQQQLVQQQPVQQQQQKGIVRLSVK